VKHWSHLNIAGNIEIYLKPSCSIDDIEDNSTLRRGNPVTHNIYGVATTLNSANYIYFVGLQKLLEMGKPEAGQVKGGCHG